MAGGSAALAPGAGSSGGKTLLTPERRLLWDAFDATLRERTEAGVFEEPESSLVRRRSKGEADGPRFTGGVFGLLGYSPISEPLPAPSAPSSGGGERLGCWTFDRSFRTCVPDCLDEMAEDGAGPCDGWLDCSDVQRELDAAALCKLASAIPSDESPGFVRGPRISGATSAAEELITAAWNLMLANLDLVAWAACKTTGSVDTNEFADLLDCINGKGLSRVTVRVLEIEENRFGSYHALYGTSIVWIAGNSDSFSNYVAMWSGGDEDTRACAALNFSSILLHDLTHLAGFSYIDLRDSKCYAAYLIQNAYRWGVLHRYPSASRPSCCDGLDDDDYYGCGTFYDPEYTCDTTGSASCGDGGGTYLGGGGDVWRWVGLGWDLLRWRIGLYFGLRHWVLTKAWDLFLEGAQRVLAALQRAWDDTTDWVAETWRDLIGWLGRLVDGSLDGSGGGCGCDCEECYTHCPELWEERGGTCTPLVESDHPAMMRCMADCGLGAVPDEPAELMGASG
jgi:hypothetical protein